MAAQDRPRGGDGPAPDLIRPDHGAEPPGPPAAAFAARRVAPYPPRPGGVRPLRAAPGLHGPADGRPGVRSRPGFELTGHLSRDVRYDSPGPGEAREHAGVGVRDHLSRQ